MSGKADRKELARLLAVGIGLLIVFGLINSATHGGALRTFNRIQDAVSPGPQAPVPTTSVTAARTELGKLRVAELATEPAYHRSAFGPAWEDTAVPGVVAANHCDTRDDILRRDMTADQPATGCRLKSGTLVDPYTGNTIHWTSHKAAAVQIDHVVPLAAAWHKGASGWDAAKRQQFANDPRNLLAVDGPTNVSKSDRLADHWRPRAGFQCRFAVTVVTVETAYGLSVTEDERDALNQMLGRCA